MSRHWSDVIVARNDLIRKLEAAGRLGDVEVERLKAAAELRRHAFLSALIITGQNGFGRDVSLRPARIASAPPVFSRLTPLATPLPSRFRRHCAGSCVKRRFFGMRLRTSPPFSTGARA